MAKKSAKKGKAPARKAAATMPKPTKITPASKIRPKGEVYRIMADHAGVSRKQIVAAFDALSQLLAADLGRGCGMANVGGLMKVVVRRIPAKPARRGVPNPFKPGELMDVAAKPARNVVKVRPLRSLKSMV